MAYKRLFLVYGQTFKDSNIRYQAKKILQEINLCEDDIKKGYEASDISMYDIMECDGIYFGYDSFSESYKIGKIVHRDQYNENRRGGDGASEVFDLEIPSTERLKEIMSTTRYFGDHEISLNELFTKMGLDISKFTLGTCNYFY